MTRGIRAPGKRRGPGIWAIAGAAVLALGVSGSVLAEQQVLNVYNWSDYIDPAVLENFQKETGIKLNYDVYDSNEVLEAKLMAGGSGNNKGAILGAYVIWGIWIGTTFLTDLLPYTLKSRAPYIRFLVIGILLEFILLYRPQGLLGEEKKVSKLIE